MAHFMQSESMTKSIWLFACALVGLLYIFNDYGRADAQTAGQNQSRDSHSSFQPLQTHPKITHPAPAGAILIAPVALMPDKPAWVTIESASGDPLPGVSLLVNSDVADTNARGVAVFRAPNQGAVSLSLKSGDGQEIIHRDYALAANGLLCRPFAMESVRRLVPSNHAGPCRLLYAPAVVQPGGTAALLGVGFAGQPGLDKVLVDGASAQVVAGSECCLVAKLPDNLTLGAMKPVFVSTVSGDTESLEVDVASAQIEWSGNMHRKETAVEGRVSLLGTSLPAVIGMFNDSPDELIISMPNAGAPLGQESLIIMPGGDENYQVLKATHASSRSPSIHLTVLPDAPELLDLPSGKTVKRSDPVVWQTLDYTLLVKLKRSCLAVENAIWQDRLLTHSETSAQMEKQLARQRALSQRHIALSSMVNAREALFTAHGGTAVQIAQATDDATGGAYYVLESQVRALYLVPESPVIKQQPVAAIPMRMHLYDQLPEPKFKLWPPVSDTIQTKQPLQVSNTSANQVVATPIK